MADHATAYFARVEAMNRAGVRWRLVVNGKEDSLHLSEASVNARYYELSELSDVKEIRWHREALRGNMWVTG